MSFSPLRPPQTDAEWARNTERRLRALESASTAIRVGSWTLSSDQDTGGLVAVSSGQAPVSISAPTYAPSSIPAEAVQNDMPRLLGVGVPAGGSPVDITTSLSAALFSVSVAIPSSLRVLADGHVWLDQTVPTSRETSTLKIGVYVDSTETMATSGGLHTVYSGYTPANATVDDVLVDDRDGLMTEYENGTLIPFSQVFSINAVPGEVLAFEVKAEAGASDQWSFINSADEQASILKIYELPPT